MSRMTPLLGLLLLFAFACAPQAPPAAPAAGPPPEVTVAVPLVKRTVLWDRFTGRLEAVQSVDVRSRVSGYLSSVHFREGALVSAGDLLFVVDRRPFEVALARAEAAVVRQRAALTEAEAALAQAKASLAGAEAQALLAKQQYDRVAELIAKGAASQNDLESRRSQLAQGEAGVTAARANIGAQEARIGAAKAAVAAAQVERRAAALDLSYTVIRAPISGRVDSALITRGNFITGGQGADVLTTIVSSDPIYCSFDASEAELLRYTRMAQDGTRESSRDVRNPIYLALQDEQGFPHLGHMDFVGNRVNRNTGTIRGRAIFPNPTGLLQPGMFAKLRLAGSAPFDAVLIPDSAIGSDQTKRFVYVVGEDNAVSLRQVEMGPLIDGLRLIESGLAAGDRVVIKGLQRVRPGVVVAPTTEVLSDEATEDGLPDSYEPLPPEKWLSAPPDKAPPGIDGDKEEDK